MSTPVKMNLEAGKNIITALVVKAQMEYCVMVPIKGQILFHRYLP